jgi:DNA-binding NarL/FixJ family response regulator
MNDMKPGSTPVVIVEDEPRLRQVFEEFINEAEGFYCLGSLETAEQAINEIPRMAARVVLMDIHLPGKSGIDAVKDLKRRYPELLIIMLTVHQDDEVIFQALKAGANGYLLKKSAPDELIEAIQDVMAGGAPMSTTIARKVIQFFHTQGRKSDDWQELSNREVEVLEHLSRGYTYKEISSQLGISFETVRCHVRHIYDKLQVRSRTEAVARFLNGRSRGDPNRGDSV